MKLASCGCSFGFGCSVVRLVFGHPELPRPSVNAPTRPQSRESTARVGSERRSQPQHPAFCSRAIG
eukprot:scaffold2217_cov132-Isochrysis_galbana.AAC.9